MAGGKSLAGQSPASTPAKRPEAVGTAPSGLCGVYLNQLIIGAAINEGAAFFAGGWRISSKGIQSLWP